MLHKVIALKVLSITTENTKAITNISSSTPLNTTSVQKKREREDIKSKRMIKRRNRIQYRKY